MIVSPAWRGERFAVLGLARSGAATVRTLLAGGARVVAWDGSEEARKALSPLERGLGEGMPSSASPEAPPYPNPLPGGEREQLELADPLSIDLTGFAGVVVSPGVPLNRHPIAAHAAAAGVPVIGDIELFAQVRAALPAHKVVGITGTNGKSTTTALVHHMLQTAGVPSLMGGNIGLPILEQEPLAPNDKGLGVYVLELSSYQIDLTRSLDCDVAVLLNITPDHLDRYDGFDAYAASKARLFAMQGKGHAAIIGIGDDASAAIAKTVVRSGRAEDVTKIAPGVCMDQSRWPALQGPHNAQNALAAIAVAEALGLDNAAIDRALASFAGLPHRTQMVATRNGVAFVNDSKATNPESTAPALRAYPRVHWIVGGRAKGDSLEACRPGFPHVVRAYTIGEAGPMFAAGLAGEMPVRESGTVAQAVADAAAQARPGETVLLSPACASFDQFRDFEERGAAFVRAVEALP